MWQKRFSHIYLEDGVEPYPLTRTILDRFPGATRVRVADYKHVFARRRQSFQAQKRSPKLILARKKDNWIYPGPSQSQDFGYRNFYYNSLLLNCIYNCDYCYLQGMYPSGNLVVFVNEDDFFSATKRAIEERPFPEEPLYLCISYDKDLLAYENVAPYCARFIEFTRSHEELLIEIRTKSANWNALAEVSPCPRVILAWTLSPRSVIARYEKQTPGLEQRIRIIKRCLDRGWQVRLCFDPVLRIDGWEATYKDFFREVFRALPARSIRDASLGLFRMNADFFKRIKKQRSDSDILYYPFERKSSLITYPQADRRNMLDSLQEELEAHLPKEKIETWV